ncbi:membrane-spanning protein, partial [Fictibacillus fluitans]
SVLAAFFLFRIFPVGHTDNSTGRQVKVVERKMIKWSSLLFMTFMLGLFIYYFMKDDSSRWQVALGGIAVSALPLCLLLMKRNPFPLVLIIGYFLFLLSATYLGSIMQFYLKFQWWDTTVHFYKGVFVGLCAMSLYKMFVPEKLRDRVSPWLYFLFVLSFSCLASALWEIYEFTADLVATHTMQLGGNKDTMEDLLAGVAGGLIAALYAKWKIGR